MATDNPISPAIRDEVRGAILEALKEEKAPRAALYVRSLLKASISMAAIGVLLYFVWQTSFNSTWIAACLGFWMLLSIGFVLYSYPQPRLEVRGYWAPWVFAKLLIGMTCLSALELVLCPHFAFAHLGTAHPFAFLSALTSQYMEWGGMKGCMFLCGLTFSSLGGLFGFWFIRKHFTFANIRFLQGAIGIGLLGQAPVWLLQLSQGGEFIYFALWTAGSLLAFLLLSTIFKIAGERLAQA